MTDRRRINGPPSGTTQPVFVVGTSSSIGPQSNNRPQRTRKVNELRKIFLKTGLVSAAAGSAYLELEVPQLLPSSRHELIPTTSTIKLNCSVHGPKPVPRTASFSPNLQLSASVKFSPFATRVRRGYIRDSCERDLGIHLETALKGVIIPDRWPKSAIDVVVTVLEGEEDHWWGSLQGDQKGVEGLGLMNVLAGSITVASAALADAKIDCLDLLAGGVAAIVPDQDMKGVRILDPCPTEHDEIRSVCVVGYLPARDEISEVWIRGDLTRVEELVDSAVNAARGAQLILREAVKESADRWTQQLRDFKVKSDMTGEEKTMDVEMKT